MKVITNMNIALLTILVIYQAIMSMLDMKDIKKYTDIEITEKHRIKFYKEAIICTYFTFKSK